MTAIRLPAGGWKPRAYQMSGWKALEQGCKRAALVWHRRSGKDDFCLRWAGNAAHLRTGTYWHMLPQAAQARKAMWEAINPHTGVRRIDEAFPRELRETTREQEMMIRFKCGSTWQLVGSDNYNSLVGAPPVGVVFSEWALAKPSAWGYLRPTLAENDGWAPFNYTPRGKNHGFRTYQQALNNPEWFAEKLTAQDTGVFSESQLAAELAEYIADYGEDEGLAFFEQEYNCSFDAPVIGSYYGKQLLRLEQQGRFVVGLYDPTLPVDTAWDFGHTDDTAIWFVQIHRGEVRVIDYYATHGEDIDHYVDVLKSKPYSYDRHWVPHDAKAKVFAAAGKTIIEQAAALGITMTLVENISVQQGIQAVRLMLSQCWFDTEAASEGVECLRQYQREWDDDKKVFRKTPLHNWASHGADAFRMLAVAFRERMPKRKPAPKIQPQEHSLDRWWRDYEDELRMDD